MNALTIITKLSSGLGLTLELTLLSLILGLSLALILTVLAESRFTYLTKSVDAFVFVIRGTPLLVQIFIIYYGSGQFLWVRDSFLWTILKQPMGCAIIALMLNTSAYTTVLLRSAIRSIPTGEIEACYALGLSRWQMFHRIIIPRAFRIALPAYSNEVIMILKGTSLVSTITLMDLMGVSRNLIAMTYDTIPIFIITGLLYLLLNGVIMWVFKRLQSKYAY